MSIVIPFANKKFENGFRDGQQKTIESVISNNCKIVMLNSPTGSGKSLLGMSLGHYKNYPYQTLYCCNSKLLQDQLSDDFKEAKVLKGRSNYACNLLPHMTAADCSEKCDQVQERDIDCTYEKEKIIAINSLYTILSTQYYLNEANWVGRFSKHKTVVIDEADTLEDLLIGFISLDIHPKIIDKYELGIPAKITKLDSWRDWSKRTSESLLKVYMKFPDKIEIKTEEGLKQAQEKKRIQSLIFKLNTMTQNLDETWVFEHQDKFSFRPLWLTPGLAEIYFKKHADQFVLMSATLLNKAIQCKLLGLEQSETEYIEVNNPIPVKNRTVIYHPIKRLKFGENEHEVYNEIKTICDRNSNAKGLVHAVSYDRAKKIADVIGKRAITHNTYDKNNQIQRFFRSTNGVLVSPSCERGLDLKDDLARFNIIPKVPFPNMKDKIVSKRLYSSPFGQQWYESVTAQTIQQMSGRTCRHIDDWGTTYILDASFESIARYTSQDFQKSIQCKW